MKFHLIITPQIQWCQCSISFQWFTYLRCSFISNFVPCSLYYWICISFSFHSFVYCYLHYILSSPLRFSDVNVVLVFNDSLIEIAPSAPISLSVHCIIGFVFHFHFIHLFICYLHYILSSRSRSSSVNVVLVFNDSLIILAPSGPIRLSAHISLFIIFLFSSLSLSSFFFLASFLPILFIHYSFLCFSSFFFFLFVVLFCCCLFVHLLHFHHPTDPVISM